MDKLRLSDIVKYILLGAIFTVSIVSSCLLLHYSKFNSLDDFNDYIKLAETLPSFIVTACIIAISYLVGLLIHAFLELLVNWYNKMQTNWNCFLLKTFVQFLIKILCYNGTVNHICNSLKRVGLKNENTPSWIFLSNKPDRILSVLSEKISLGRESSSKNEHLYLNEFVLGLRLTLIAVISILLVRTAYLDNPWRHAFLILALGVVLWLIFSSFARLFAIKYIKYIDTCAEANDIDISELLNKNKLSCAYILVNTTEDRKHPFFNKAVDSIIKQDYPNMIIILSEERSHQEENNESEAQRELNEILKANANNKKKTIEVIYCADNYYGASGASIAIKKMFLDVASDSDIAIFLDDDDEFVSPTAVSTIMTKMIATKADICIVGFRTTDELGFSLILGDKKLYNDLLDEVSSKNKAVPYTSIDDLCRAASMGWTKCYKHSTLNTYCEVIEKYDKDCEVFIKLKAYEDFLDYMCFLFKGIKIVAVNESIYNFRQHGTSFTAKSTLKCFKERRIGFLHYLEECVKHEDNKDKFSDNASDEVMKFIRYKLYVISEILKKKSDDNNIEKYTVCQFLMDYNINTIKDLDTQDKMNRIKEFYEDIEKSYKRIENARK